MALRIGATEPHAFGDATMPTKFTAHNDAYSRALYLRFKNALEPLLAQVAPDWLMHHMELVRDQAEFGLDERVEIRIVIKPAGSARVVDDMADLATGLRRLGIDRP